MRGTMGILSTLIICSGLREALQYSQLTWNQMMKYPCNQLRIVYHERKLFRTEALGRQMSPEQKESEMPKMVSQSMSLKGSLFLWQSSGRYWQTRHSCCCIYLKWNSDRHCEPRAPVSHTSAFTPVVLQQASGEHLQPRPLIMLLYLQAKSSNLAHKCFHSTDLYSMGLEIRRLHIHEKYLVLLLQVRTGSA